MGIAIDGCGVPTFNLPLERMAFLFAKLSAFDDPILTEIYEAMVTYPQYIAGTNRFDTVLMETLGKSIIIKSAAEGLIAIGLKGGIGIVVKAMDGNYRAIPPAVIEILKNYIDISLEQYGKLAHFAEPLLLNHSAKIVGKIKVEKGALKETFFFVVGWIK